MLFFSAQKVIFSQSRWIRFHANFMWRIIKFLSNKRNSIQFYKQFTCNVNKFDRHAIHVEINVLFCTVHGKMLSTLNAELYICDAKTKCSIKRLLLFMFPLYRVADGKSCIPMDWNNFRCYWKFQAIFEYYQQIKLNFKVVVRSFIKYTKLCSIFNVIESKRIKCLECALLRIL